MANLLKNQILKHLSKFAKNLNPEHLNISAFRGEGELHHLELNEEILTELLELPSWLQIKRAFCNRVTARIPWASLKSVPIRLHLDDLELVIETTENLRPLSKVHVPSYSSGGSYGFADKVIDGMSVYVGNVIVTFRSQAFFASIELSQVTLESKTPQFKPAELKYTRLKDMRKGELLIFKELQFASMKIQACSTVDNSLSPLRLITNDARCRITLKKKLSDCSVLGCRLAVVVDTLLYVFTDSQLRAAKVFVDSLLHLIKKGQEQAKKVKALRKLESTELHDDVRPGHPQQSASQRQQAAQNACSPFQAHDVVETSYHFACKQLELHLSDDAGPGRSSHPQLKNGGAMVVTLGRLYFDYYPYHPVGNWEGPGARKHWVKYTPGTPPAIWEAEDLTAFKAQLSSILRGCRPSHAPLHRTQAVEDSGGEYSSRPQSLPQSRNSLDSGSNWSTGRPPPALPQLKRLMSACVIFRLTEFRVHQVTTHEKKHLREFLSVVASGYKASKKSHKKSGDQEMAPLPGNSYRVHMEFIQYYYPGSMDFPLPPMKLYVHCNPIAVKFDELTMCWANAVLGNLLSEWDLTGEVQKTEEREVDPDIPPSPPLDVKFEMIMPKITLEGPEIPGQPDRPTSLQFMSARLLLSNYRQQANGSRADLAKCLEGIQNGAMFFGSSFPSNKDDPVLVHPKFVQHATGNDHVAAPPVAPGSEESSRKSSSCEASRDLLWYDAKDVWYCQCDPVWGEFWGAKAIDNRPVPLFDPIPLAVWIYAKTKPGSSECYALLDVPSLVTVQLNHYQNLFLMRLVDRLSSMSDILTADSERSAKPGSKHRLCVGGMFPQVDISLLMPSQTADKLPSVSSPGESSVIAETSSMTDLVAIGGNEKRFHYHTNDRQGTLDSLDSVIAFFPKVENGPVPHPLHQRDEIIVTNATGAKEPVSRKETLKHQRSNSSIGTASGTPTPTATAGPPSVGGLPESRSQSSFLTGAFSNLKVQDNLNTMKKGMSSFLTNMAMNSPSLSPLHSSTNMANQSSPVDLDRLVVEEDAMSTISSESDTFIHLSSSEAAGFYQSVDQCLLEFPGASRSAVRVPAADDVEVGAEALDEASFANPPSPSDELPSSLARRKDVISVLTIRVGQVQLVQHVEDSESVMKLECCHLALEDCPAIPWDDFQTKFSSGKHSWSDSSADPEHKCSVKIRYSQRKVARPPCHPFSQDVLSVSPEANFLLRSRLDRFSKEQMRHVTAEDTEDHEKWQRHLCRLLCEDLKSHGGTMVEMEVKDLRLHLLMSISMGLTALFEEEDIVPPLPMKIRVENVRVHLPDDRPPSSITSPPVMPLLFHVPFMTIVRDCAGVFHFLFCRDCTEDERRHSRSSGVQTCPIPPDSLPLPQRQTNHFGFSLPAGGGGNAVQRRLSQLEKENERLRRDLISAREADLRAKQLQTALETSEQEKISLLQTMRYLQNDIMRLEEERTQARRGSYLSSTGGT